LLIAGCGGKPTGPTQDEQVEMLVSKVPDAVGRPERLQKLFTAAAIPPADQRQKYSRLMFFAKSNRVTGDNATIVVEVEDGLGKSLGEVEWKAVREADGWKLTAAPLP
jgi:hypothetical protein